MGVQPCNIIPVQYSLKVYPGLQKVQQLTTLALSGCLSLTEAAHHFIFAEIRFQAERGRPSEPTPPTPTSSLPSSESTGVLEDVATLRLKRQSNKD